MQLGSNQLGMRVCLACVLFSLQSVGNIHAVKPADTAIPSVSLPSFSRNNEEYAVGAIIERVSDSFDLYATVFLLGHQLKLPLDDRLKNSLPSPSWPSALSSLGRGERSGASNFTCRIRHKDGGSYYTVEGEFVPKGITSNSEGELHLDILRCKMQDTERAYMELAGSSEELEIEIFEDTSPLIRFMVPWVSRTTANGRFGNAANFDSTLSAWKGFNRSAPGVWSNDRLHLCVPEWGDSPNKVTLPPLLEFLQHHLLLGVDHIFMSFRPEENEDFFLWNYLDSFISEGSVTVNTMTDYGLDGLYR
jgi:hypothetical protein